MPGHPDIASSLQVVQRTRKISAFRECRIGLWNTGLADRNHERSRNLNGYLVLAWTGKEWLKEMMQ